jgi:hypothetical protein
MGKVVPFKPRAPKRATPSRAAHLQPLLEPIFALSFDGKTEEERRALLAQCGEEYGSLIRSYFGEKDAQHFVRVFCGGVRSGGAR